MNFFPLAATIIFRRFYDDTTFIKFKQAAE